MMSRTVLFSLFTCVAAVASSGAASASDGSVFAAQEASAMRSTTRCDTYWIAVYACWDRAGGSINGRYNGVGNTPAGAANSAISQCYASCRNDEWHICQVDSNPWCAGGG
jgi:hypothetical protein